MSVSNVKEFNETGSAVQTEGRKRTWEEEKQWQKRIAEIARQACIKHNVYDDEGNPFLKGFPY